MFMIAPGNGLDCFVSVGATEPRREASMLLWRLRIFSFTKVMPAPLSPRVISCPRCFALLAATKAPRRQARSDAWEAPGFGRVGR